MRPGTGKAPASARAETASEMPASRATHSAAKALVGGASAAATNPAAAMTPASAIWRRRSPVRSGA